MKNLDHYLHKTLVYTFYFLFLTTPLIWYPSLSELFEFPKMVYVYIFTTIILCLWLSRMVVSGKLLFTRSKFDIPLALFVFSQILSTIFSIHPHTSIYGYYSRFHGGLLSTLSYVTLYYAFIANFDKNLARKAVSFIVAGAVMASLYALPEHYGYSPSCLAVTGELNVDCWVQDVQTRIYGTFGQPNWLAAYIIIVSPLIWYLASKSKQMFSANIGVIIGIQTLLLAVLLYTRSKSGLIGFALAFALFAFVSLLKSRQTAKNISVFSAILVIVSLYIGTEFTPSLTSFSRYTQKTTPQSETVTGNSVGTVLENGGTDSGQIRKIVWTGALEVFKHNPIFGAGAETFAYSYYKYRPMEHNNVSEWDFLYNKAHNEFLNLAATTGAFGIGTYLLFMAYFTLSSLIYSLKNQETDFLPLALLSGFLGLSVSNFFGFSTVAVTLLFFLFPAIFATHTSGTTPFLPVSPVNITTLTKKQRKQLQRSEHINNESLDSVAYFALSIIGFIGTFFIYQNFKYLNADLAYSKAEKLEKSGNLNAALTSYQEAIHLSSNEPVFHNDFADALSKAALIEAQAGREPSTISLAQKAFTESATTLRLNPYHLNFYKTQAGVYIRLGSLDGKLLDSAKSILTKAQDLAPTDAKLTYNLALINSDQGKLEETQKLLEQTVSMKPNYEAARMLLAEIYTQNQDYQKAREQYQYILNYIAPQNTKAEEALKSLPMN